MIISWKSLKGAFIWAEFVASNTRCRAARWLNMAMGVCQLEYLIKSPDFRAFQVMLSHLAKRESLQKMNGPSTGNNNPRNLQICTVPTTRSAWVHRAAWFHVHFINIIHTHTHTEIFHEKRETFPAEWNWFTIQLSSQQAIRRQKCKIPTHEKVSFNIFSPFYGSSVFPTMRTLFFWLHSTRRIFFCSFCPVHRQEMFIVFSQVAWSRSDSTRICWCVSPLATWLIQLFSYKWRQLGRESPATT